MKKWADSLSKTWLSLFTPPSSINEEKEKPLLDQVEALVDIVDLNWFVVYTPDKGHGVVIETMYPHFNEYIEAVEIHTESMKNMQMVLESRCRHKPVSLPINKFFLSPDGYYDNVHDNVIAFREAVRRLCVQLHASKEASNALGNYNLRLLTPLLDNIRSVLFTLSEVKDIAS